MAGTVGHWWFEPSEASHCCSSAVINSFIRTVTTSFGSVCFGSLIVAVIQALKMLANTARQEGDSGECGAILLCLAECILACLASIVEYFNKVRVRKCVVGLLCLSQGIHRPFASSHTASFIRQFNKSVGIYLRRTLRLLILGSWKECLYTVSKPWVGSCDC